MAYQSMLPQILEYATTHPRNFPPESSSLGLIVPAKNIHLKYDFHIKLARTQIETGETVVPQGEEEAFATFMADAWTFWAFWDYNALEIFLGSLASRFVEVTNNRMPESFQLLTAQSATAPETSTSTLTSLPRTQRESAADTTVTHSPATETGWGKSADSLADSVSSLSLFRNASLEPGSKQESTSPKQEIERWKTQLRDRDSVIARLQDKLSAMTPSADIGIAIRHRFVEKERISFGKISGQSIDKPRQEIIDKGNAAAHGGNGTVDALLLKHNLIPDENRQIFAEIYGIDVDSYLNLPLKMKKASDIRASVFAEIGIHGGLGTETQRRAVRAVVLQIETLYQALGRADFEQSSEVDELLAQAESMKDEIVKTYKQRFNRNR
ncbi:hypothetical protein L207DRAFT_601319 [Hyaloscypha variabilis F]|uniref:Uncharacterized protein n=1 Tax=Hyaloscypha variabilis (strain UAMH 11265 / GT02V1 / F) TaxID=1149755 RepID=A0A2J6REL8_HYAVF|nr:hypothetical protein L207DRAFT_601319 [Hyaloscypha variabilis F]